LIVYVFNLINMPVIRTQAHRVRGNLSSTVYAPPFDIRGSMKEAEQRL
jgi:hypothetical protein